MDSLCLGHTFQLKLCREDRRDGDETGGWMRLGNDPELERNESASVSSGSHSVSLCPVPTTSTAFPFVALARIAAGVPRSNRSNLGPSERRPNTTGSTGNPKPSMRWGAIQTATANGRSKLQHTSNERDTRLGFSRFVPSATWSNQHTTVRSFHGYRDVPFRTISYGLRRR